MTDKLDLVLESIKDLKDSHGKRLDKIDDNLEDHMLRCDLLEKKDDKIEEAARLQEKMFNERVEKLELPGKVLKFLRQSVLYIMSFLGLILGIVKLIEYWSK